MNFFKKRPQKNSEPEGREGVVICPRCNASYYDKAWHHNLRNHNNIASVDNVDFELCPADKMKKDGSFAGQVIVERFPRNLKNEIISQVENIGNTARSRDVLDRILELNASDRRIEIRVSDTQLALAVARQVHKAHKNSKADMVMPEHGEVMRLRVWWPE